MLGLLDEINCINEPFFLHKYAIYGIWCQNETTYSGRICIYAILLSILSVVSWAIELLQFYKYTYI